MIDPTNPRVIQDSMRAMAGYSQGLIPTLMRTVARMIGSATNPRQQTPVFDRILSQIQPQVIRGLSQQSAVAAQSFVPQTRVVYDRDVIDPVTGARSTRTFDESDIQDLLATAQISQQDLDRDYRRREETVDIGPERLNVSQVDHVIRTMLRGAEAMGISAERLAGIDWAGIDLDTILTGAVENGEFNLDLSRIPGLDQDIADAFRNIADGISVSGMQPVIQNAPLNRSQRTQAIEEPQNQQSPQSQQSLMAVNDRMQRVLSAIGLGGLGRQLGGQFSQFISRAYNQQQNDAVNAANRAAQNQAMIRNGGRMGPPPLPPNGPPPLPGEFGWRDRLVRFGLNRAAGAGRWAFNKLPQFIQQPILNTATALGSQGAAAAGMNAAGQAAAGQAAAGAARVAVGLRMLSLGVGAAVAAIGAVISALKSLADSAWKTTMRVTQYNGVLAAAQAMSEIRDILRDMQMGRALESTGKDRIEAADALKDARLPLEMSSAMLGNMIGTKIDGLKTGLWGIFNDALLGPGLEILKEIATALNKIGIVSDETLKSVEKGVDEIVGAIEGNGTSAGHPLGGDTVFTQMFNQAIKNDMPLIPPPAQGGGAPIIPPAGP